MYTKLRWHKWLSHHPTLRKLQTAAFMRSICQGIAVVVTSLYLKELGWSGGAIGGLLIAAGLFRTIMTTFAGTWNSLLGPRKLLLLAEAVTAAAGITAACTRSSSLLCAAIIAAGFGMGHTGSSGPAGPIERRWLGAFGSRSGSGGIFGKNAMLTYGGMGIGSLLASLTPWLQAWLPGAAAYRVVYGLLAACALTGAAVLLTVEGGARQNKPQKAADKPQSSGLSAAEIHEPNHTVEMLDPQKAALPHPAATLHAQQTTVNTRRAWHATEASEANKTANRQAAAVTEVIKSTDRQATAAAEASEQPAKPTAAVDRTTALLAQHPPEASLPSARLRTKRTLIAAGLAAAAAVSAAALPLCRQHVPGAIAPVITFVLLMVAAVVRVSGGPKEELTSIVQIVNTVAVTLSGTMSSYWLAAKFGASAGMAGIVLAASYLLAGALSLAGEHAARTFGPVKAVVYFQLAGVVCTLALPWVPNFWEAAVLFALCSMFNLGSRGTRNAVMFDNRARHKQSGWAKFTSFLVRFGVVLWPGAFGSLIEEGEYVLPFYMAAAIQSVSAWLYGRVRGTRTEQADRS
ncbi:MFS transporter [Paenibacillus protaetiae]|uniref:MFS transporter n=1 Tax=Paenibacillus protaetiae TaxID=2509456 RepID=A0A4P6EVG6_9BACL|nr:MFS transporter [Paenibacillus protaetiae]QAY66525.1 MFS transporter [Paenibacillus protaetiae]